MTEPSTSAVDLAVAARIQAAKVRVAAAQQRRTSLAEARKYGLARRHAAKLRALAEAEQRAQQQLPGDGQDDEQDHDDGGEA